MNEFDEFGDELGRIAPEVMRALGDGAAPDHEIPISWMGSVGKAVADTLNRLAPEVRADVFQLVERHLARGSELMRTAVATGLLEVVASEVSGGRLDGPELARLLGPESRAYIDAWDQFTLGRSSLGPS